MTAPIRSMPESRIHRVKWNMFSFKGVSWDQANNRFRAYIWHEGRSNYLGQRSTAEEAAKLYDEAARERHGAEAFLNFPLKGENGALPQQTKQAGVCRNGHLLKDFGYQHANEIRCRECNRIAVAKYASQRKQKPC